MELGILDRRELFKRFFITFVEKICHIFDIFDLKLFSFANCLSNMKKALYKLIFETLFHDIELWYVIE